MKANHRHLTGRASSQSSLESLACSCIMSEKGSQIKSRPFRNYIPGPLLSSSSSRPTTFSHIFISFHSFPEGYRGFSTSLPVGSVLLEGPSEDELDSLFDTPSSSSQPTLEQSLSPPSSQKPSFPQLKNSSNKLDRDSDHHKFDHRRDPTPTLFETGLLTSPIPSPISLNLNKKNTRTSKLNRTAIVNRILSLTWRRRPHDAVHTWWEAHRQGCIHPILSECAARLCRMLSKPQYFGWSRGAGKRPDIVVPQGDMFEGSSESGSVGDDAGRDARMIEYLSWYLDVHGPKGVAEWAWGTLEEWGPTRGNLDRRRSGDDGDMEWEKAREEAGYLQVIRVWDALSKAQKRKLSSRGGLEDSWSSTTTSDTNQGSSFNIENAEEMDPYSYSLSPSLTADWYSRLLFGAVMVAHACLRRLSNLTEGNVPEDSVQGPVAAHDDTSPFRPVFAKLLSQTWVSLAPVPWPTPNILHLAEEKLGRRAPLEDIRLFLYQTSFAQSYSPTHWDRSFCSSINRDISSFQPFPSLCSDTNRPGLRSFEKKWSSYSNAIDPNSPFFWILGLKSPWRDSGRTVRVPTAGKTRDENSFQSPSRLKSSLSASSPTYYSLPSASVSSTAFSTFLQGFSNAAVASSLDSGLNDTIWRSLKRLNMLSNQERREVIFKGDMQVASELGNVKRVQGIWKNIIFGGSDNSVPGEPPQGETSQDSEKDLECWGFYIRSLFQSGQILRGKKELDELLTNEEIWNDGGIMESGTVFLVNVLKGMISRRMVFEARGFFDSLRLKWTLSSRPEPYNVLLEAYATQFLFGTNTKNVSDRSDQVNHGSPIDNATKLIQAMLEEDSIQPNHLTIACLLKMKPLEPLALKIISEQNSLPIITPDTTGGGRLTALTSSSVVIHEHLTAGVIRPLTKFNAPNLSSDPRRAEENTLDPEKLNLASKLLFDAMSQVSSDRGLTSLSLYRAGIMVLRGYLKLAERELDEAAVWKRRIEEAEWRAREFARAHKEKHQAQNEENTIARGTISHHDDDELSNDQPDNISLVTTRANQSLIYHSRLSESYLTSLTRLKRKLTLDHRTILDQPTYKELVKVLLKSDKTVRIEEAIKIWEEYHEVDLDFFRNWKSYKVGDLDDAEWRKTRGGSSSLGLSNSPRIPQKPLGGTKVPDPLHDRFHGQSRETSVEGMWSLILGGLEKNGEGWRGKGLVKMMRKDGYLPIGEELQSTVRVVSRAEVPE